MHTVTHLLTATLLAGLGSAAAFGDTPTYSFQDLGTLGGPESVAMGLNDEGQVVGWSNVDGCIAQGHPCRHAFLWDDGTMIDLGKLAGDEESVARAINNDGVIVGTSESDVVAGFGTFHGFVYDAGVMTALPDLGVGQSFPHDINNAGTIAGWTQDPTVLRDRAVTWTGGAIDNVGDTESHTYNRAQGISESGVVVGFAWNLFQPNDAILFDGGWFTIGGTGGQFQNAEASDVNDSGVAVGLQAFPSGGWHPAVWTQDEPAGIDLGLLPGMTLGSLYDVNEAGHAVGASYTDFFPVMSRAVYYDGETMIDLNDLLPAGTNALLWDAQEINEAGDIVGTALVNGAFHAFLMSVDGDGPWTDLGSALAGTHGDPVLTGTGTLEDNTPVELALTNALENSTTFLIVGLSTLDAPFKGGTLVPALDLGGFPVPLPTGPLGEIAVNATWPAGIPAGVSLYVQEWIQDAAGPAGFSASNAVSATTP